MPPREPKAPAPPPDTSWRDVKVPKTEAELQEAISRGVARALELASTAKDITEAVKAATTWYETLYGADDDDGLGSGLRPQGANGHGGR